LFVWKPFAGACTDRTAWLLILAAAAPLALTEPLDKQAVRLLVPYLTFLLYAVVSLAWTQSPGKGSATVVQLIVPVLVHLLAWGLPDRWRRPRPPGGCWTAPLWLCHFDPSVGIAPQAIAVRIATAVYILLPVCSLSTFSAGLYISVG
jgi:hypothetical protein